MPNSDKTFWRYVHQKPSYKFNTGKGQFFPLSFVPVIFYRKTAVLYSMLCQRRSWRGFTACWTSETDMKKIIDGSISRPVWPLMNTVAEL